MFLYIFAGLLGVVNMIIWGIYGDLLIEKFKLLKVLRSVFIGLAWSVFLFFINSQLPLFIIALVVIALERITTEIYKTLIRVEDQRKYKIPSDLNIMIGRRFKFLFGFVLIFMLGTLIYLIEISISKIYLTLIIGFIIALGGMLKDAPFEGFDTLKFFRSPLIAIIVGVGLLLTFPSLAGKYFLLAVAGAERIVSEFYKKILRGRVPGKFQKKELNTSWQYKRKWLLIPYTLGSACLLYLFYLK